MKRRWFSYAAALGLFVLLILRSAAAADGARRGLALWTGVLIPSLLPFFTAANLLIRLGFTDAAGRKITRMFGRFSKLSGPEQGIFLLGLSGGYPLGASAAAEAVRSGDMDVREAERLLCFCDNTGPAFAVGALGSGVFGSAGWGLAIWGAHAISAVILSFFFSPKTSSRRTSVGIPDRTSAAEALTASVAAAVNALIAVGGYVVFISALLGVTEELGFPTKTAEALAGLTGGDGALLRALLAGVLELSSGIGALGARTPEPASLAAGAFLLSFGGLCVHLQAAAVTAGTGIRLRGRLAGKFLQGLMSAGIVYAAARLLL